MEPTELLWVGEDDLALICHQHPGLTLYLIRLVTRRLVADSERYGATPPAALPDAPGAAQERRAG
jgi:CRP-like cAMP-binding protein